MSKMPESKKYNDYAKLCRSSMRLLNKVLEYVPKIMHEYISYNVLVCIVDNSGYIDIKYLVHPLPSVYLLNQFLRVKISVTFNDFEDFSKGMIDIMNWQTDVLLTVRRINKACEIKNDGIHIIPIQDTPQKDNTRSETKKATNNDNFPPSPSPGLPYSELSSNSTLL
nr:416_t:CDS:2 [Entrophospora candida]